VYYFFSIIFCTSTNGITKNAQNIAIKYSLQPKGAISKKLWIFGTKTTIATSIIHTTKDKFKSLLANGFEVSIEFL
jgi:hypothetical protein